MVALPSPFAGRAAALGAVLLAASGCFRYVPAEATVVPPGAEVRLELTRVGFAQLPEIPNRSGPDLPGIVVRQEPGRLLLRVPVNIRSDGMVTGTVEQDVVIPTSDIVRVERREFSRTRTGLVALGGLALLVGVIEGFGKGGAPVGEEPNPPIDEEAGQGGAALRASIPILSLLFH